MTEERPSIADIRRWMKNNVNEFVDECNEINCTAMVEAWDDECGSGEETLDPDHEAWGIAVEVSEWFEKSSSTIRGEMGDLTE